MAINKTLLRKVRNHILAEPRRYNQGRFGRADDNAPCGTACCIAGWAIVLSGKASLEDARDDFETLDEDAQGLGAKLLGLSYNESNVVFDGDANDWPQQFNTAFHVSDDKAAQARVAADYINHIIKTGKVT